MADNVSIKDGTGATKSAAADELADGSYAPKVQLLDGTTSGTPISPATQATSAAILAKIIAAPATEAKQDTMVASLSVLDDWDESDRAKVNPIAGQAGVAAGSGTVSALTQRVVLATDVALPAGENHLGEVGGNLLVIAVTPAVEATPDYSTGDVLGGKMTLANAARVSAGTGYIVGVRITSQADITVPIDVIFFKADPTNTTWTENAAVAVHASDLTMIVGAVQVFNWFDLGTPVVGFAECRIPFDLASGTSLYAVMIARGTINLASTTDIIIEVTVDRN